MPTPSTFASAAAGNSHSQHQTRDPSSEWSRRTNGATQTFRRQPSVTTTATAAAPSPAAQQSDQPPRYVPPYRNGTLPEASTRYDKDQMLGIYTMAASSGALSDGLHELVLSGWQQEGANGTSAGWSRADSSHSHPGPEVCWDKHGSMEPLGLREMDDEERELFATSVNTLIKPPATSKDGAQANGLPGRKASISSSATTPGAFGLSSPGLTRGPRRRETSESFPFPQNSVTSPGAFPRDDPRAASPPPALLRRRTDHKDLKQSEESADEGKSTSTPFGTVRRNPAGPPLSAGFNAPTSPWSASGPQSAVMPPMGAFGNFALGGQLGQQQQQQQQQQHAHPNDKRPGISSGRSESRFRNLLNKDSGEDIGQRPPERKTSISSLSRVNENESWRAQNPSHDPLTETDEDMPSGSAALTMDADVSPPQPRQNYRGFGTPSKQNVPDEYGFGAFGMTSDNAHGLGQGFLPGREAFQQTPAPPRTGQSGGPEPPMSPTDTNPYQSPEQHGIDRVTQDPGNDSHDSHSAHLPGLGHYGGDSSHQLGGLGGLGALPNLGRNPGTQGAASDRSQNSSAGPNRGFPSLGGLGQLGGAAGSAAWPVSQGGLGTPGRQNVGLNNPFGGGVFSNTMGDLQSPGLAGLGPGTMLNHQGGQFGASRMASMFPPPMQDQMRQGDTDRDLASEQHNPGFPGLGEYGRATESPFGKQGFGQGQDSQSQQQDLGDAQPGQFGAPGQTPQPQHGLQELQSQAQNQPPGSSTSNQPPAPQQRTMVMPDRMRWIYRDPQGQTQGPWTGLEMHDWYKAGFFSPELLVKKYEDPDYEPLAQLIRRIGNSREPFLVPQIGIPHGAPSGAGPNTWAGSGAAAAPSGAAQPPFASSFPSFGTTLTAEQQNALERRKQEEQYLMARQKEHLAQAQIAQRMQLQGGHAGLMAGQLHHHSSAHSLQSQPSFGSMTSPTGYQPSPVQGPTAGVPQAPSQGFFDNSFRSPQSGPGVGAVGNDNLARIREEEIPGILDRLNLSDNRSGAGQIGAPGQRYNGGQHGSSQDLHEQQVQQMLQDRARLQQEQAEHDAQQQVDEQRQAVNERLQQFHQLQGQSTNKYQPDTSRQTQTATEPSTGESSTVQSSVGSPEVSADDQRRPHPEPLSLTEQVQKAASAKQSPAPQQVGFPQPFPPAPSQSPLPAPAAQRTSRPSVAYQLQTDSRDHSQTPSAETPSAAVAPWAKEPVEAPRGPSLKEIQEAEAKKAAELEEMAAAARRAAFQKEMEAQAQTTAAAPGLPVSSTWGAGSPATPTGSTPAAWAKTTQKPSGSTSSKTLAQIQKEEEARKRKLAAAAAAAQQVSAINAVPAPAVGKSYANLAGKITSPPSNPNMGGAWTTVGAGGKAKTPGGPVPTVTRTVSNNIVPTVQAPAARKAPVRSNTLGNPGAVNAQDEFKKWALNELRPDLNKGINAEDFVSGLLNFPPETEILTEAVHAASSTIDSRHFAEEWIRRKRLADKGLIDSSVPKTGSPAQVGEKGAGGWSQVAKKGPAKEEPKEEANGNFRVVPSKKKGGKR